MLFGHACKAHCKNPKLAPLDQLLCRLWALPLYSSPPLVPGRAGGSERSRKLAVEGKRWPPTRATQLVWKVAASVYAPACLRAWDRRRHTAERKLWRVRLHCKRLRVKSSNRKGEETRTSRFHQMRPLLLPCDKTTLVARLRVHIKSTASACVTGATCVYVSLWVCVCVCTCL